MLAKWERKIFGGLQVWLQGYPNKNRPQILVSLGNVVSSTRYWIWYYFVGRK